MINVDRDEDGQPLGAKCDCGEYLPSYGPGRDYSCDKCGRDYNSNGQRLAPRSQWGKETGETAADYDQGVANPWRSFDEY